MRTPQCISENRQTRKKKGGKRSSKKSKTKEKGKKKKCILKYKVLSKQRVSIQMICWGANSLWESKQNRIRFTSFQTGFDSLDIPGKIKFDFKVRGKRYCKSVGGLLNTSVPTAVYI